MSYCGLIPPILSVIKKFYCSCMASTVGDLSGETIPKTYPELEKILKDVKWINSAVKKMDVFSDGNEIIEATLTPFGPSAGFFSELGKLAVKYKDPSDPMNPPTDCIVKFLPQGFEKRLILDLVNLPRSEVYFYYYMLRRESKNNMPPMPIPTPRILYADYCHNNNNALIFMERITDVLGNQKGPDDMDQARAQMICLAKYHKYNWGAKHPQAKMLMDTSSPVTPILGIKMKMNLKPILKMLKEANNYVPPNEVVNALMNTVPKSLGKILDWCCDSPFMTICHGDARLDNLYFAPNKDERYEGEKYEAGLYDWAQGVIAPNFYDISWAVSHSFRKEFYNEHSDKLVKLYWDSLLKELGPQIADKLVYEEFLIGYAMSEAIAVSKCVIAFESLAKSKKDPSYPHKKRLVMDGLENSLRTMEQLDAVKAIEDLVAGKFDSHAAESFKQQRRTSSFIGLNNTAKVAPTADE